jgi:hypothetical protein
MAIYPDDAVISANAFATLNGGTAVYNNTSSNTVFPLPITVSYV